MAARRKLGLMEKVEILLQQAVCPLCQNPLKGEKIDYDHTVPLALGGEDRPNNIRAVHRACHKIKTAGKPATTAGSDIHAIAKSRRLSKTEQEFRARLLEKAPVPAFLPADYQPRPKSKIPSRPFPKRPPRERTGRHTSPSD